LSVLSKLKSKGSSYSAMMVLCVAYRTRIQHRPQPNPALARVPAWSVASVQCWPCLWHVLPLRWHKVHH